MCVLAGATSRHVASQLVLDADREYVITRKAWAVAPAQPAPGGSATGGMELRPLAHAEPHGTLLAVTRCVTR